MNGYRTSLNLVIGLLSGKKKPKQFISAYEIVIRNKTLSLAKEETANGMERTALCLATNFASWSREPMSDDYIYKNCFSRSLCGLTPTELSGFCSFCMSALWVLLSCQCLLVLISLSLGFYVGYLDWVSVQTLLQKILLVKCGLA